MKKIIYLLIFLTSSSFVYAQWWPEVQISDAGENSFTSVNNVWNIATNGNTVHIVWWDYRNINYELYYKRSTDAGITWGSEIRLTNNPSNSSYPSIAASGEVVHIFWEENRDGNFEIYYKRSTDDGVTWGPDTRLTYNSSNSVGAVAAVSGQMVNLVWFDNRDGNNEIYYKRSPDAGISWGPDTRITDNNAISTAASIAISGSVLHVVWRENRDGNYEIYYKRSSDVGLNWGVDTRLTNNVNFSDVASVAVTGLFVHVTWSDNRDGNFETYYKRSTDAGLTWGTDIRLTNNPALTEFPNIAASGTTVHVVWHDERDGNFEIYSKRSTDNGVNWESDTRITNNSNFQKYPNSAISGTTLHVVWFDNRTNNTEIFYKRNPTGNPVGIENISNEAPSSYSLSQNYPNPFNPTTRVRFDIPKQDLVTIKIFDILGRELTTLVNEQLMPGTYEVDWDGTGFTSGVYFYKLTTESYAETKKMMLIK